MPAIIIPASLDLAEKATVTDLPDHKPAAWIKKQTGPAVRPLAVGEGRIMWAQYAGRANLLAMAFAMVTDMPPATIAGPIVITGGDGTEPAALTPDQVFATVLDLGSALMFLDAVLS